MVLVKVGGSVVALAEWVLAQSGKVPSWKMVCAQVFMARLSSRTPIRFIRRPVRTCSGDGAAEQHRPSGQMEKKMVAQPTAGSTTVSHKCRPQVLPRPTWLPGQVISPLHGGSLGARHLATEWSWVMPIKHKDHVKKVIKSSLRQRKASLAQ